MTVPVTAKPGPDLWPAVPSLADADADADKDRKATKASAPSPAKGSMKVNFRMNSPTGADGCPIYYRHNVMKNDL
jgi:hypothetical protein